MANALLGHRQEVPSWSGKFWHHDEFGFLAIHCEDTRAHRPPLGWAFVRSFLDGDTEVFEYRKICPECLHHCCILRELA